jgi:hypothetical protein
MNTAIPNLFIVGAPKCGTTSLYEYLRRQTGIFFPSSQDKLGRAKEPSHLCPELEITERYSIKDRDEYLALYCGSEDALWRGDASTNYLISEVAPESIRQLSPGARIVVMLRPPVEMMHSYHSELVRHHHEDILDFHEAVAASEDRRNGLRIPAGTGVPRCLDYFAISRFAPQVERYLRVFGHDAVKIVLLEDMAAAPDETLRGILQFLGVPESPRDEFRIYNETPRNGLLERFVTRMYGREIVKRLTQMFLPYEARRRVLALLRRTERRLARVDPRDEALRRSCEIDVERLSALIGRDLHHWQSGPSADPAHGAHAVVKPSHQSATSSGDSTA